MGYSSFDALSGADPREWDPMGAQGRQWEGCGTCGCLFPGRSGSALRGSGSGLAAVSCSYCLKGRAVTAATLSCRRRMLSHSCSAAPVGLNFQSFLLTAVKLLETGQALPPSPLPVWLFSLPLFIFFSGSQSEKDIAFKQRNIRSHHKVMLNISFFSGSGSFFSSREQQEYLMNTENTAAVFFFRGALGIESALIIYRADISWKKGWGGEEMWHLYIFCRQ